MLQADISAVLPLVMQHGKVTAPSVACSLAKVCKASRAALQQCQPCLEVTLLVKNYADLGRLAGFAVWLQKNGSLLKELTLLYKMVSVAELGAYKAAECLVAQAFNIARAQGVLFRLQSFRTNRFMGAHVISNLPAASLTSLHITGPSLTQVRMSGMASALPQLTGLEHLVLTLKHERTITMPDTLRQLPSALLQSLQALCRLRRLELCVSCSFWSSLQTLPPSLEQLTVMQLSGRTGCMLDISHLTNLQHLHVQAPDDGLAEGSCLPPRLPSLCWNDTLLPANASSLLQGVQKLALDNCSLVQPADVLRGLGGISSLQQLSLEYDGSDAAVAAAAPTWKSLPQLQGLTVWEFGSSEREDEAGFRGGVRFLLGLAEATSLTSLHIDLNHGLELVVACLQGLTKLSVLSLENGNSSRLEMMPLTKLTQLTALSLKWCKMDDATAVVVVGGLTGLRSLTVIQQGEKAGITTDAVIPVIAQQLKGLRELSLRIPALELGNVSFSYAFDLLKGLTQLTYLQIPSHVFHRRQLGRTLHCHVAGFDA